MYGFEANPLTQAQLAEKCRSLPESDGKCVVVEVEIDSDAKLQPLPVQAELSYLIGGQGRFDRASI